MKPVLKWTGSKSRLLDLIIPTFIHASMLVSGKKYIEPFAGSCSVAINVDAGNMILNDRNTQLMNFYGELRRSPLLLVEKIKQVREWSRESGDKEAFFYVMRDTYNALASDVGNKRLLAALFWYLNKTCFNGMYREDSKGNYNIPFGQRECPYPESNDFVRMASILNRCELHNKCYSELLSVASAGDIVYLDPPYIPVSKTANFSSYLKHGFGVENHKNLCEQMKELDKMGVTVVMSNSASDLTQEIYGCLENFQFHSIVAHRLISGLARGRGKVREFIITNRKNI